MSAAEQFHDHFSGVASEYSAFRPEYPPALFNALEQLVSRQHTVWDCAAGTGQASVPLGRRFPFVLASDASVAQVANAVAHPQVHYVVAHANACPLRDQTVGLITVAQSLHWFQFDAFYAEARRLLLPQGVLAVWSYGLLRVDDNAAVQQVIHEFERQIKHWWPPERAHVDDGYRSVGFPFAAIPLPEFHMGIAWTLSQFLGYVRTWSAVTRKRSAEGTDPVIELGEELARVWGPQALLQFRWPLTVLAGRNA